MGLLALGRREKTETAHGRERAAQRGQCVEVRRLGESLRQALQRWQGHADGVVAEQVAWSLGR